MKTCSLGGSRFFWSIESHVREHSLVTQKTFIWISPAVETPAVRDFTVLFPSCSCVTLFPSCFEAWSEYLNRRQEQHCMKYYGNVFVILNGPPTIVEMTYRRLCCNWRVNRMGNLRLRTEFRWETSSRTSALKTKNNLRRITFKWVWGLLFVRTDGVRNWLSVVKWRGFTCRLWLYILLDPQVVFVKDLDSEDTCVWIFDGERHLCATRHGNTLILVLISICDKVAKCNVNSRKMTSSK
jgi:hypothetical protein